MAQGSDTFTGLTAGTTLQGRQLETGSQYWQIGTANTVLGASSGDAVRNATNTSINGGMLVSSTVGAGVPYTNISDCGTNVLVSANVRFTGTIGEVRVNALLSRSSSDPYGSGSNGDYESRMVYINGSTAYWDLRKLVSNAATQLGSSNKTFVSGTWYSLAGYNSDAVKVVYGDGAVVITSTDNAVTYKGAGFYLYQEGSGISTTKTCELDDYIVSPPPKSVSSGARQAVQRAATR